MINVGMRRASSFVSSKLFVWPSVSGKCAASGLRGDGLIISAVEDTDVTVMAAAL